MDGRQHELWQRVSGFPVDEPGAAFSFEVRLAQENGWEPAFARRVIDEYRRFVFLMLEAGHPVTPSDQVDQAWHLHLTYTRSYWDRLCRGVAGRALHHDPTRGGGREEAKFDDWYARTLDSYRRFFGEVPPADIWPPAEVRFGIDPRCIRVNTARNWVVPKAKARRVIGASGLGLTGAAALGGCGVLLASGGIGSGIWLVLATVAFVLVVIVVAARSATRQPHDRHRQSGSGTSTSGCGGAGLAGCGLSSGHHGSGCGSHHSGSGCGGSSGGDSGGSGCGGGGCGGGGGD